MTTNPVQSLTDEQLLHDLSSAAAAERTAIARLIALLAEMDVRRLYLAQGYSSLFVYCTRSLHLSEHATYGRIEAARAARRFPIVLERLKDGSVTLTTVCLLSTHLTADNHERVLESARHKTKREVEQLIAAMRPRPPVPTLVRKLPGPKTAAAGVVPGVSDEIGTAALPAVDEAEVHVPVFQRPAPAVILPLAPERYKVQLTIGRATYDKLRDVQYLLRHLVPNGDPAVIFDRALTVLLQDLERRKLAKVERPRPVKPPPTRSRHVPAAVRREVWERDGGRCAFVGTDGRCRERGLLEFHHVIPFAEGGETTAANLQLRCRPHNAHEASEYCGAPMLRERSIGYGGSVRIELPGGVTTPDGWNNPDYLTTKRRDRLTQPHEQDVPVFRSFSAMATERPGPSSTVVHRAQCASIGRRDRTRPPRRTRSSGATEKLIFGTARERSAPLAAIFRPF